MWSISLGRDEFRPEVPIPDPTPPVCSSDHLSASQAADVAGLQLQFADVFSSLPIDTPLIAHRIKT